MSEAQTMRAERPREAEGWAYLALMILIGSGMLIGGGGIRFPLYEMLIQIAAIPALIIGFLYIQPDQWRQIRVPVYLLLAGAVWAVLQIIPLPPGLWQSLPGRETLAQIAELTGRAEDWRALSLNPELTLQSGLTLIIPIAALVSYACLNPVQRENALFFIILLVVVHIVVSFAQTISGGTSFYLFDTSHKGLPIGLFANRNHTAQVMLMSMFLFVGLMLPRGRSESLTPSRLMMSAAVVLLLAFTIIATNSRTVSLLVLLALAAIGLQLLAKSGGLKRNLIYLALAVAALGGLGFFFFMGNFGAVGGLVDRFQAMEDHRFEFWPTALETMQAYLPFGSGLGTFDMAFRAEEPLANVGTHFVNAAHNDYIEIAIETGVVGPLLLLIFVAWMAQRLFRVGRGQPIAFNAAIALFCIMLHSLTDYPIRTYAVLVPAAVLLAAFALTRPSAKSTINGPKNGPDNGREIGPEIGRANGPANGV